MTTNNIITDLVSFILEKRTCLNSYFVAHNILTLSLDASAPISVRIKDDKL